MLSSLISARTKSNLLSRLLEKYKILWHKQIVASISLVNQSNPQPKKLYNSDFCVVGWSALGYKVKIPFFILGYALMKKA